MRDERKGQTAVIFTSRRTHADPAGYAQASARMAALAATQTGFRGIDSVRDADGAGITVSYWASDADARAWRDHPDHAATRARGRDHWYADWSVTVAEIRRDYRSDP